MAKFEKRTCDEAGCNAEEEYPAGEAQKFTIMPRTLNYEDFGINQSSAVARGLPLHISGDMCLNCWNGWWTRVSEATSPKPTVG